MALRRRRRPEQEQKKGEEPPLPSLLPVEKAPPPLEPTPEDEPFKVDEIAERAAKGDFDVGLLTKQIIRVAMSNTRDAFHMTFVSGPDLPSKSEMISNFATHVIGSLEDQLFAAIVRRAREGGEVDPVAASLMTAAPALSVHVAFSLALHFILVHYDAALNLNYPVSALASSMMGYMPHVPTDVFREVYKRIMSGE